MRAFILVAGILLAGIVRSEPQQQWIFLMPSDYHGGEAPEEPGSGWLALLEADKRWYLRAAIVSSEHIADGALDEEGQKTGVRITSSLSGTVALLRLPAIKLGEVDTVNISFKPARPILISEQEELDFKGQRYQLEVRESQVFLRKGATATLLADLFVGGPDSVDQAWLLWAGDLDRDGKLDLLVGHEGYNSSGACLFLSASAPLGSLVRQVACHGGVGC